LMRVIPDGHPGGGEHEKAERGNGGSRMGGHGRGGMGGGGMGSGGPGGASINLGG
jgi:hypothetical protein